MSRWKRYYRVSLVLAIISFLILQGFLIRTNIRYGNRSEISDTSVSTLFSPYQPYFDLTSGAPAHSLQDWTYYALGHAQPQETDSRLDLLISRFGQTYSSILDTTVVQNLSALQPSLEYRGLYYYNQDLWTLGMWEEELNQTSSNLHSVIVRFTTTGEEVDRYPLPVKQVIHEEDSRSPEDHNQLLFVNSTIVAYLSSPTEDQSTVVYYDYINRSFTERDIFNPYHQNYVHYDSDLLWLRYSADPYELQDSEDTNDLGTSPSLHAISFQNPSESFSRSIVIGDLVSSNVQVPLTTVRTDRIENPVFYHNITLLQVDGQQVFNPVFIQEFNNQSEQAFYGFEIYSPQSIFLSPFVIITISSTSIFAIMALVSSIKSSQDSEKIGDITSLSS